VDDDAQLQVMIIITDHFNFHALEMFLYTKIILVKFVSDLRQVNGFLLVLHLSPPIKLTDILLKGALNTINHLP
jgi:hypothetical protein